MTAKSKLATDRDPWERQPKEGDLQWSAFVEYRLGGADRRVTTGPVAAKYKPDRCQRWSVQWLWVARAQAWDAHVDAEGRKAELKAIRDMRERHVKIAMTMQGLGVRELGKHAKKSAEVDKPTMAVREAVEVAEKGVRLERLNRGEPETTTSQDVTGSLVTVDGDQTESAREIVMRHLRRLARDDG